MEAELKPLVMERGMVKASLTRFKRFFKEVTVETPIGPLQKRLEANLGLYDNFNRVQYKIELLVMGTEAAATHEFEREVFEATYFDLIAEVEAYIASARSSSQSQRSSSSQVSPAAFSPVNPAQLAVKLPTIQLPSFDGSYSEWVKFRDTFLSLIDGNDLLSDLQKFHYLHSSLKGSAARVIQSFGISHTNYKLAWDALKARYEDAATLLKHHVNAFLDLAPISKQSRTALQEFTDDANNHLAALRSLASPTEIWDALVIQILSRKLDIISLREWEKRVATSSGKPTFEKFIEFAKDRSRYLENVSTTQVATGKAEWRPQGSGARKFERLTTHVSSVSSQCSCCSGNHALYKCEKFKKLRLNDKREIVQRSQRCYNCLETGHRVQNCTRRSCSFCDKRHHSLLHCDSKLRYCEKENIVNQEVSANISQQSYVAKNANNLIDYTILPTAIVHIEDSKGRKQECRVLLDSGSQANFITLEFSKKLGIPSIPIRTIVSGLGRIPNSIKGQVELKLFSRYNSFKTNISCLTIDNITEDMPNMPLNRSAVSIPSNIYLADSHFDRCKGIDMLVGAGLFWKILCIGQHKAGPELLWQKTQFGWVLGGNLTWPASYAPNIIKRCNLQVVTNLELHGQLEKFWNIEEPPRTNDSIDSCETHFLETVDRDSSGRYIVSIPFNDKVINLGNSRDQARKRLLVLERKLVRQPELREQYVQFMDEYESLGHMSQISAEGNTCELDYYLPHHAVYKHGSTTTKLRVVFDGSAKSSSGVSLNNTQMVGPAVQSDLFSIVIRFRLHKYVLSADIAKMYRQVLVQNKDRRFQRILWRRSTADPIQTYELNTVTYGTASAPFLATRVLRQVGLECAERSPEISQTIINDFYVDDLLTGTETIREAQEMREKITKILEQAGFQLRKWATNSPNILKNNLQSVEDKEISLDKDPKTLGLLWSPDKDLLRFALSFEKHRRITKRVILSEIAQIFDPLGIIGPIITRAKIILQGLWQLKTGWDESVTQELHTQWQQYRNNLQEVASLRIPRRVVIGKLESTELHGFSDASEKAYGACVYLRSLTTSGSWEVRLLCAKSRVAPLKTISLPRLELCGALLLAQLVNRVKLALRTPINNIQYWSDSTVALTWLKQSPSRWKTFIANRVSEIQELSKSEHWHHVSSQDNPADILSRGATPSCLASTNIWWSGPVWLSMNREHWPESGAQVVDAPEERQVKTAMISSKLADNSIFKRFSNYSRLIRVTAYCLRFFNNLRALHKSKSNEIYKTRILAIPELRLAEETLLRLAQKEVFSQELSALQKTRSLPSTSTLLSLNPFLDSVGLIRVGGRLSKAPITYEKKHPVILPRRHPLTDLIINYEHVRLLHAGCELVTASLREKYWPLACRRNIRRIIRGCVKCFKVNPHGIECIMGELPAARVTPARAFHTCGIDYAGPFLTKERTRSKVTTKSYLCVFVCFVTKAVHLELATDLSTEAFLNCFRRFIARRGRSHCIVTDNGTNFVGARNELRELKTLLNSDKHKSRILNFLSEERIEWQLIPPHAPHFGGLWESGVKSAKYHLKRIIGEQRLTFEELYTLLTQVESCLNSRPITPISSDPNDLNPLTPGHFLIGDAPTALPGPDLTDIKTNRLNRYELIQQMFQHFWHRWKTEYLHQLQQRSKWRTSSPQTLRVDTLVLIKEDNLPPLRWRLGRIKELHPGTDGGTRVATVKTADGTFKRPITKLCILPVHDTDSKSEVNDASIDKV